MGLDPVLLALADCPVIQQQEPGGYIVQNPYPVISASDDLVLAHEICHKLAGRTNAQKFATACHVRMDPDFSYILNLLVDWWDELNHSKYSMYLESKIAKLHERDKDIPPPPGLEDLWKLYFTGVKPVDMGDISGIEDLIVYADRIIDSITQGSSIESLKRGGKITLSAKNDLVVNNTRSDSFYLKTVSKYNHIIDTVSSLWIKNKYKLTPSYFGEINWRNLPGLMLGEKIGLPVFNLFKKIEMARNIYLVVDRSGSTYQIKNPIMETAVIITESFRRLNVPISIMDVGHTDSVINKISEPLQLDWFVPVAAGGTPLGDVCNLIDNSLPEDYLLIITDGQPDSWNKLNASLQKFKGSYLTFVIGSSFRAYYQNTGGRAVSVEPTTIVRELMHDSTFTN